ncbi:MAG TPA: fibronectin type III domain-containing protein, partial [Fibrobacteria bacterium]|nr:fibronectin type III domain-containing protein [Fibrobacteria bacterium]
GSGFTHDVTSVSGSGGNLDFGGSTLKVTGNADLSGLNTLTAGTGRLEFTGASAQTFTPKNGATHPLILHAAAGGLDISTNALTCLGFTHTAGNLNLAGQDLTVSGSGNLLVSGATTTVSGLDSRILTVGGNARFAGTAAAKLGLDAASSWTLAVTGTLSAANVRLKNSAATGSTGVADSSVNLGFNTGWTFLDTVKPENVSGFLATAVGGTSVVLAWTPSVSEDADSVMLRYRADGTYPASHTDGTLWRQVSAAKIADTVTGLPDKTIHHFAAFVKDFSGNYSPAAAAARDSSRTPDVTPPANVAALKAAAITSSTAFLAWTPSGSPDADTVMIRYQIGYVHPSDTADGFLWRRLPVAATADTITGLAANTVYAFSLFTRDSSGNWSDGDPGARDTSLWQLPVSGSLSVTDSAGLTRDADPALVFSASGADSLRFAQLADTATAAWFPLRNLDSLNLGSADGRKILAAQFKNAFGRRSPWYLDTTVVDRVGPLVAIGLDSAHGRWTWPDVLPGTARDTVSGLDRISVIRRRIVDGHHFDGSAWVARPDTARFILAPSDTFFYA